MGRSVVDGYFRWLVSLVNGERYKRLLKELFDTDFYYVIEKDENRKADGWRLKYKYGREYDISNEELDAELGHTNCSVLEMMVALAWRIENDIMEDDSYGCRLATWFWNMIDNLGLGDQDDNHFDRPHVHHIIERFLEREYLPNGIGGLFSTMSTSIDMRNVEIWYQAMRYLSEYY